MIILAIETSCDETCAAVVTLLRQGFGRASVKILSNVVYSQIDLHKEFGGVVPNIAKRAHEEKIEFVIKKALGKEIVDAIAVTAGPGLAIALEVGIRHAKEWASKLDKPLIAVNHIEGHVLSGLTPEVKFPAMALVVSGKHTDLIWVEKIGQYEIVARTMDDALGEALDKAARMLGLGYPGGAELEKRAALGDSKKYPLPLPMARSKELAFSYSGLKTAMWRLVNSLSLSEQTINDLAAAFQNRAFQHLLRITKLVMEKYPTQDLLVGGGVAANAKLREEIKRLSYEAGGNAWFPGKGMYGDNAAMIGIVAGFKAERGEFADPNKIDRLPRWRVDENAFVPHP